MLCIELVKEVIHFEIKGRVFPRMIIQGKVENGIFIGRECLHLSIVIIVEMVILTVYANEIIPIQSELLFIPVIGHAESNQIFGGIPMIHKGISTGDFHMGPPQPS